MLGPVVAGILDAVGDDPDALAVPPLEDLGDGVAVGDRLVGRTAGAVRSAKRR